MVSSLILTKTGISVDPSRLSIDLLSKPTINLTNFSFALGETSNIDIDIIKFDMNLQHLFHGKLVIDNILLQNPKITFSNQASKKPTSLPKLELTYLKDNLNKLFIWLPEDQKNLALTFRDAASPYSGNMKGSLFLSREKKEILIQTTINEFEIETSGFSLSSIDQYTNLNSISADQLTLTTKINSNFEIEGNMSGQGIIIRSETKDILFDSKNLNVSFMFSENINRLSIAPFKIDYPNSEISLHFSSDRLSNLSEIQLIGNNIHIDQVKKMSLAAFKNNGFVNDLFNILRAGVSPEINISFQAKDLNHLFLPENLTFKGHIEDGEVKIPRTDLIASHIEGSAEIHKGILDINTTRALIKSSILNEGHLSLDLLGFDHVPFDGNFLLDVDLAMIPETIGSLLPGTLLEKELSKTHHVIGRSNVRLDLSIPTDSNNLDVKIDSDDFSVKGDYERIPETISLERINFKYDSAKVNLTHTKGVLTGIKIDDLDMALEFKEEPKINIHSGSGQISLDSIFPFLLSHKKIESILSPFKRGNGKIDVNSIQLSGPILTPEKLVYEIIGESHHLNLTTHLNQREIEDLSCQYKISDKNFSLEKITAKIQNLSWLETFVEKKYLDSLRTPFDGLNSKFQTVGGKILLESELLFPEGQKIEIKIDENNNTLGIRKMIILDPGFSNAIITLRSDAEKNQYDFNGILNTKTFNKLLTPESYLDKKINDFTEGESILFHTDHDSTINIFTKKINLTSFFSPQKSFTTKNTIFSNKTVKFKTENLSIKNWNIKNIDSEISFKNDDVYIRLENAQICDLETKGYINLEKDRVLIGLPFKAQNKDNIQNLLSCLLKKEGFMDGHYSLIGEITSDSPKQNFLNTLKGPVIFKADEGRVYKLTLLSRILSVLNVSSLFRGSIPDVTQNGFAYKYIAIEADIKDSIIYINNAIVDGIDMTIVFNGQLDLKNDYIDLTCLVAPFKTVDLIIQKIPIINTLLGGNLVSVPVKATGKISDPIVVPLHPSAVGEGLISMMKNIVKTPIKLLDKITDDKK